MNDDRASGFLRLALWTTATTYLLILVGGLVRASGAGLGCPDWPRCFGSWIPPASAAAIPPHFDAAQFNSTLMWTEYLNRLLGIAVGFLVLATVTSAWRHHRREPQIVWPSVAALLLTVFQGWLGGRVVAYELAAWVVTVHMIVALVIVSLLLYATVYAFYETSPAFAGGYTPAPPRTLLTRCTSVLILLTLVQVGLGTQVRGGVDAAIDAHVARDAALATVGTLDFLHRDSALAVLVLAMGVLLIVQSRHRREGVLARWSYAVLTLAAAQVGLGVLMVYVHLSPSAQVAHLTIASLLLGAQTVLLLAAWWQPSPDSVV